MYIPIYTYIHIFIIVMSQTRNVINMPCNHLNGALAYNNIQLANQICRFLLTELYILLTELRACTRTYTRTYITIINKIYIQRRVRPPIDVFFYLFAIDAHKLYLHTSIYVCMSGYVNTYMYVRTYQVLIRSYRGFYLLSVRHVIALKNGYKLF